MSVSGSGSDELSATAMQLRATPPNCFETDVILLDLDVAREFVNRMEFTDVEGDHQDSQIPVFGGMVLTDVEGEHQDSQNSESGVSNMVFTDVEGDLSGAPTAVFGGMVYTDVEGEHQDSKTSGSGVNNMVFTDVEGDLSGAPTAAIGRMEFTDVAGEHQDSQTSVQQTRRKKVHFNLEDSSSDEDVVNCSYRNKRDRSMLHILNKRCCPSDCIGTISRSDVLTSRANLAEKRKWEQREWILSYLQAHHKVVQGRRQYAFMVGTTHVCMEAWRVVFGITRTRLWEIQRSLERGVKKFLPPNFHKRGVRSIPVTEALAWLKRHARLVGDYMPNTTSVHLPSCSTKAQVYDMMRSEMEAYGVQVCSESHFYKAWREEFPYITIPKTNRFAKCDTCTEIKANLQACTLKVEKLKLIKERERHLVQQRCERQKYYKHASKARREPSKYMSLIVDGMDQKCMALPSFVNESKTSSSSTKLATHLTGVIVHGRGQHAFLDLRDVPHDSNLTATVLLETIRLYAGSLPPVLYIQMDNCGRENKNKYILALCCLLVELNIFKKIKVSFLMVGHTHEDIDQFFSRISVHIQRHNMYSMNTLLKHIPEAYKKQNTTSTRLTDIYNIRDWLLPNMAELSNHSRPHIFRITKGPTGKAVIDTKKWSTCADYTSTSGDPHLLLDHPTGQPDYVQRKMDVELDRLSKDLAKLERLLPASARSEWTTLIRKLRLEESGEAERSGDWPLYDLLLPTSHSSQDDALHLQLDGSAESSDEEQIPQVHVGKKTKQKVKHTHPTPGDMVAVFLDQYRQDWPQVGRVQEVLDGEIMIQWFTGTVTSQWKPLMKSMENAGLKEPWTECIDPANLLMPPFSLTRTCKLPGEVQQELRKKYDLLYDEY